MSTDIFQHGGPVRVGDTTYQLPEARYHGRRDDGVYVPIYLDGMADVDLVKKAMLALKDEARVLRAAGHTVR